MSKQYELNKNLAQMLKGGVIMDVTTPEQAKIAEAAGACAVMALERIPADIRAAYTSRHSRGRRRFPHERP
ncbi:pyridoxal biosynthesis lyase PdxS [Ruminococcus sp. CAG:579]|nr:pyridoxal biosynthesis lyase PdxS [Ruminococcus sp. CAG:579]